jgi:hypothetical protein
MNEEILSKIRNKLTAPKTALERLAKGEKVSQEFLELAMKELRDMSELLNGKIRILNVRHVYTIYSD